MTVFPLFGRFLPSPRARQARDVLTAGDGVHLHAKPFGRQDKVFVDIGSMETEIANLSGGLFGCTFDLDVPPLDPFVLTIDIARRYTVEVGGDVDVNLDPVADEGEEKTVGLTWKTSAVRRGTGDAFIYVRALDGSGDADGDMTVFYLNLARHPRVEMCQVRLLSPSAPESRPTITTAPKGGSVEQYEVSVSL